MKKDVFPLAVNQSYTFKQDISLLHSLIDRLENEFVPGNIERCQNKIVSTVERICDNKMRQYVPIDVRQYFKEESKDEE